MYCYAEIDPITNICFATLKSEIPADNEALILVDAQSCGIAIGKKWTGEYWEDVPEPETPPEPTRWQLIDFRKRFTAVEKVALYQAAETDIMIKIFMDDLAATPVVVQDDPELNQGIAYVVSKGSLTLERAREILDNPDFSVE